MVDTALGISCLAILLTIGLLSPFIHHAFDSSDSIDNDSDGFIDDIPGQDVTFLGFWDIIKSIASVFAWSFGMLPIWLDFLLVFPRIIMIMYLVELARWV